MFLLSKHVPAGGRSYPFPPFIRVPADSPVKLPSSRSGRSAMPRTSSFRTRGRGGSVCWTRPCGYSAPSWPLCPRVRASRIVCRYFAWFLPSFWAPRVPWPDGDKLQKRFSLTARKSKTESPPLLHILSAGNVDIIVGNAQRLVETLAIAQRVIL